MFINRITEGYFSVAVDRDELSPCGEIQFRCEPNKPKILATGHPSEMPPLGCKMRVLMNLRFRSQYVQCGQCGRKYFLVIKEPEELREKWHISEHEIQELLLKMDPLDVLNILDTLRKDKIIRDIMEHHSWEILDALERSEKWKNRRFALEV